MSEILEKPEPPGEYECCDNACSPCVWDSYFERLNEWKQQRAELKAKAEEEVVSDGR
ncbi:MAG: oxidoreductase-like domain-containing protein [Neptuniibacter sp.]|uniref:oxidoreductase-like domain-containing protein n=1 Tax=Neptuniibacter sp. TaxID=1962643 RepID=UPI003B5BF933